MKLPLLFQEDSISLPNNTIQFNLSKSVLSSLLRHFADTIERKNEYVHHYVAVFPVITKKSEEQVFKDWTEFTQKHKTHSVRHDLQLFELQDKHIASLGCIGKIVQIFKFSHNNSGEQEETSNLDSLHSSKESNYTVLVECCKRCELTSVLNESKGHSSLTPIGQVKEIVLESSSKLETLEEVEEMKVYYTGLMLKLLQYTLILIKLDPLHKTLNLGTILQQQQSQLNHKSADRTSSSSSSSSSSSLSHLSAEISVVRTIMMKASMLADVIANSITDISSTVALNKAVKDTELNEKLFLLQMENISDQILFVLQLIQERIKQYQENANNGSKLLKNEDKETIIIIPKNSNTPSGSPRKPAGNNNRSNFFSNLFNRNGNKGDDNNDKEEENDLNELYEKLSSAQLPSTVENVVQKELKRIKKLPLTSPEYTVIRNYLEVVLDIPWNVLSHETKIHELQLSKVSEILNNRHYGLEEVKKRILQHVAVMILSDHKGKNDHQHVESLHHHSQSSSPSNNNHNNLKQSNKKNKHSSPTILCLAGPPGVGKTSLAKSIANALERPFEKISLGGVHDEAEIRGHRKTYIGAFPGAIVQAVRRAKCLNPVILLDEIDKMSSNSSTQRRSHGGDPQAALLEVLDPDQNEHFMDHYLGIPLDLSQVIFIATANYLENMSSPLLDRMEVINISGYTNEEKLEISSKYLIPKQIQGNALSENMIHFEKDGIDEIISSFTREAGVRQLDREIGNICRNCKEFTKQNSYFLFFYNYFLVAMEIVASKSHENDQEKIPRMTINRQLVRTVLGSPKYASDTALKEAKIGKNCSPFFCFCIF
jgi:endopeptidase La